MTTSDAAGGVTFAECVDELRSSAATAREAAESLIGQMNDDELLWLLDGDTPARAMLRLPPAVPCRASAYQASGSATAHAVS
jgi:hypothetical protein